MFGQFGFGQGFFGQSGLSDANEPTEIHLSGTAVTAINVTGTAVDTLYVSGTAVDAITVSGTFDEEI